MTKYKRENRNGVIIYTDTKKGLMNKSGKIILPEEYSRIDILYQSNLIQVEKDGKYGLFDRNGKIILPAEYDSIYNFSDPYNFHHIKVEKDKKFGLISQTGKIILPVEYDYISINNDNLINARKDGKIMYFDKYGNPTTP